MKKLAKTRSLRHISLKCVVFKILMLLRRRELDSFIEFQFQVSLYIFLYNFLKPLISYQFIVIKFGADSWFLAFSASSFLNVDELNFPPLDSSETRSTTSTCRLCTTLRPGSSTSFMKL